MELALVQTYSVRYVGEFLKRTSPDAGAILLGHPAEFLIGTVPAQNIAGGMGVGTLLIAVPLPTQELEVYKEHVVSFATWTASDDGHDGNGSLDQFAQAYFNALKQTAPIRRKKVTPEQKR